MEKQILATSRVIAPDMVAPARKRPDGDTIVNRWIKEEKDWIAQSIQLAIDNNGLEKSDGATIQYEVTSLKDGGIKITGTLELK